MIWLTNIPPVRLLHYSLAIVYHGWNYRTCLKLEKTFHISCFCEWKRRKTSLRREKIRNIPSNMVQLFPWYRVKDGVWDFATYGKSKTGFLKTIIIMYQYQCSWTVDQCQCLCLHGYLTVNINTMPTTEHILHQEI